MFAPIASDSRTANVLGVCAVVDGRPIVGNYVDIRQERA
jgi:hypothetical protein